MAREKCALSTRNTAAVLPFVQALRPLAPRLYSIASIAIFLAALLLMSWQALVEAPKRQKIAAYTQAQAKKIEEQKKTFATQAAIKESSDENPALTREERLVKTPRVSIHTAKLQGSITLKGARIDDLTLTAYREALAENSKPVTLLSPAGGGESYFIQAGWVAADGKTRVPNHDTLWQSDKTKLSATDPVTLRWDNGEGQTFELIMALDEHYMFSVTQRVINRASRSIQLQPYAFLNRAHEDPAQHYGILHEGPLGVMEGSLAEISYQELREKTNKTFENASGWLGIGDKYWLTAMIPQGEFKATFSHYEKNGHNRYQVDFLKPNVAIESGSASEQTFRIFSGAKELRIIEAYAAGDPSKNMPGITLFDRAIDFGVLYFLTKPMLMLLTFFHTHISNFGVNIMLLTIVVKLLMFPLANKSFKSMAQMRQLQPEILKLRERYGDDAIKMNQEMMALYKREKVNPASGCLPLLIQMPVFFALYKVLFVSIEMRHAPFFGWIKDLSAADPSNLFTLFGLFDWGAPSWLHLGVLPIVMCITMVLQMRQQPKPADPIQAKMMAYMPFFFLFLFASFPAGLVLYWAWSNVLSIAQQALITRAHGKAKA